MVNRFEHQAAEGEGFFLLRADFMGFGFAAQMMDGGVFFIAANAGKIIAHPAGDGSGELAALLQRFSVFIGCTLAFFPTVTAEAFPLEVVFGDCWSSLWQSRASSGGRWWHFSAVGLNRGGNRRHLSQG